MEFPVTVYESIEYFINNHKILPNDLQYGPAFIIRLEYPKKPNVTAQDIRYVVDWTEVGSCQIAESEWPILSGKMHNLVTEYDPFRQGSQCPIEGFSPQAQSQPVYQQQAAQGGGLSGFSAPITGTPGFAAPVSPLGAPAMASAVAVGPVPTMTAPTVAPAVYAPPTMSVPVTNTVPQAFAFGQPAAVPTIGAQVPQMTVATPPVVAQIPQPQQSEASLMAEVDNVFTSLQPR
jgi:hypothetical protein